MYRESVESGVLLTIGIALVTLGFQLIQQSQYMTGALLVTLGLASIIVYYIFIEKKVLRMIAYGLEKGRSGSN